MKKIISILLILIGIISIGSGCYLMYTDSDTKEETTDEEKEETEEVIISIDDIKEFSEYKSYQIAVSYDDVTYMTWKYDSNNNNMYLSVLGMYYTYYDITNDIAYTSEDGSTWVLSDDASVTVDTTETNEISEIITVIKNGNATDNGDNSYSLSVTEEEEIDCGEAIDCVVTESSTTTYDVVARFDSNGYLKSLVMSEDGSSVTYTFSDVNNTTIDVIDTSSIDTTTDSTSDSTTSSDTTIAE